ncbi:MAG: MutS-related protein [Flavobacteriaceae bacterium]
MNTPQDYYKNHIKTYAAKAKKLKKQMLVLSMLRLLVFVLSGLGIYIVFYQWAIVGVVAIVGIALFLFLLLWYNKTKSQKAFYEALVYINEEELKIASGNFHHRDMGNQFQNPKHAYSLDVDLFGRGSLFQYINRTTIAEGTLKLANCLLANNTSHIGLRQEAVKELGGKTQWRQFYTATASLVHVETPANQIIQWLQNHKPLIPKAMRFVPVVFGTISILLLGLIIFKFINAAFFGYWLMVGLGISGIYVKKINQLSLYADKLRDTFKQYAKLLDLIENETFSSELLKQKQQQIQQKEKKASVVFSELSRALDALDNRNNLISALFGNGYFLVDIKNTYRIERWIQAHGNKVADWFEVVSFFEAYNSLGGFTFNHPDFVFPKIVANASVIKAEALGHPLLNKTKRVNSDVVIDNKQFFIVTGANMAGKSTFLRTISLHIVMANTGLPVCAKSSTYNPVKLITSMRTVDSLTDDSSYFFSELTRLKYIVDTIKPEPYFVILDEILKGTNSTDKAIGSRKFVEKLVALQATGIIATHDLSLCDIENELNEVKNYYFDAQIINNELFFDYKLKQGICQNMNASFLLKKMDIV